MINHGFPMLGYGKPPMGEFFQVATRILQEVAALFPEEFLHVGGDEAERVT